MNIQRLSTLKKLRTVKVVVISAYDMGNVGDNLVSEIAKRIAQSARRGRVRVRFSPPPYRSHDIEWADVVIMGGGGLIYDSDKRNIDNYMESLKHAQLMGKKTAIIGVGVQGEIVSTYGKSRYKDVLNHVDLITIRHAAEAAELRKIGVESPIHVLPDISFCLPNFEFRSRIDIEGVKALEALVSFKGDDAVVGISVANEVWDNHLMEKLSREECEQQRKNNESLRRLVNETAKKSKVALLLHSRDDKDFYESVIKSSGNSEDITLIDLTKIKGARELLAMYGQLSGVVASRYHAFTLAIMSGLPVLGFSGKISRTIEDFLPSLSGAYIPLSELDQKNNLQKYSDVVRTGFVVSDEDIEQARHEAMKNRELVKSLVFSVK